MSLDFRQTYFLATRNKKCRSAWCRGAGDNSEFLRVWFILSVLSNKTTTQHVTLKHRCVLVSYFHGTIIKIVKYLVLNITH